MGSVHVTHDPMTRAASYTDTRQVLINFGHQVADKGNIPVITHKRQVRDGDEDAHGGEQPHQSHHWQEADRHLDPAKHLVFGRELKASNHELHADDDSAYPLSMR